MPQRKGKKKSLVGIYRQALKDILAHDWNDKGCKGCVDFIARKALRQEKLYVNP